VKTISKALFFSLLIAFSGTVLAEDWEKGESPNGAKVAPPAVNSQDVIIPAPDALNLSTGRGVYTFTKADRDMGYTVNGKPVEPGVTKILIPVAEGESPEKARSQEGQPVLRCGVNPEDRASYGKCTQNGTGAFCSPSWSECGTDPYRPYYTFCDPDSVSCVHAGRGIACDADRRCTEKRCDTMHGGKCVRGGAGQVCASDTECPTKVCYAPGNGRPPKCVAVGSRPGLTSFACLGDTDCLNLKACNDENTCGNDAPGGSHLGLCNGDGDCAKKKRTCFFSQCMGGLRADRYAADCPDGDCVFKGCNGNSCMFGALVDCLDCTHKKCHQGLCYTVDGYSQFNQCDVDSDCTTVPPTATPGILKGP
jgi:hypothetical protein